MAEEKEQENTFELVNGIFYDPFATSTAHPHFKFNSLKEKQFTEVFIYIYIILYTHPIESFLFPNHICRELERNRERNRGRKQKTTYDLKLRKKMFVSLICTF